MAVEDLTDDTFAARIAAAPVAVVDFHAAWCGPCLMFKPKFKRISEEYPQIAFFTVDGEKAPAARKTVQIDNLPFFGFYRDGRFVEGVSTATEDGFRRFVDRHLNGAEE
jgi:thiol-disulfide isomerase/thioredoxin